MGLETATYVQDFDSGNPLAGDRKNQGDDHLRLIKSVVKNTFPRATGPFYTPRTDFRAASAVLADNEANAFVFVTPGVGVVLTLPNSPPDGSFVTVLKNGIGPDPVFVNPPSGTITTAPSGGPQLIARARCDVPYEPCTFEFVGGSYILSYPGPRPGTIHLYMGPVTPSGYGAAAGQSLLRADYPELFNAWGTTWGAADGTHFSVPDLRDRFPTFSGGSYALGATGGENTHTLVTGELPSGSGGLGVSITDTRAWRTNNSLYATGASGARSAGTEFSLNPAQQDVSVISGAISGGVTGNLGSNTPHENRPPYFAITPIFRLC